MNLENYRQSPKDLYLAARDCAIGAKEVPCIGDTMQDQTSKKTLKNNG